MLPVYTNDKLSKRLTYRIKDRIAGWLRLILSDTNSRNLFMFLLLNFSFAFVELFYGFWTNSLGLISDSFHMFFDCTALIAGLVASLVTKWRADDKFTFGYVRAEVLAGFVNGLFLVFVAFFIFTEAVERAIEPPEVKHDRLFLISVLGLLVNMVGIFVFQHGGAHHGHSHGGGGHDHGHSHSDPGHGHSHGDPSLSPYGMPQQNGYDYNNFVSSNNNGQSQSLLHSHSHSHSDQSSSGVNKSGPSTQILKGVFLHILADTLGSVGVIISALLMQQFGWMIADPLCSMFIAILIVFSVYPLLKESIAILMQRVPHELDTLLPGCYRKVMELEGVLSIQEQHFWTLCSDVYVGTLKIEVRAGIDPRFVLSHTHNIFSQVGVKKLNVHIDYVV